VPDGDPFDLIGPMMVLLDTNWQLENSGRPDLGYDIEVVSNEPGTIFKAKGLRIEVDKACYDIRGAVDTLVFQAVDYEGKCLSDRRFIDWIRRVAPRTERLVTACIGTYVLAEAGLLDGRRATTHWMACENFQQRYGAVEMDPEPIYVKDGKYYSSAGVTAILDLMLALVEEDFGSEIALRVAQSMVLFLRRPANQSQFSVQLTHTMSGNKSIQTVLAHIAERPDGDLSVEALAECVNMSARNFVRVFTREVGLTPGKFVELSRIEAARSQLEQSKLPIGEIAKQCGYRTSDGMRASFDRNLGVGPSEYRRRFATFAVAAD
jgi:transcriptional regulator GlxA family with amidase domain